MAQEGTNQFRLVTQEGAVVTCDVRLADMCHILDPYRTQEEISVPNVTEATLRKVIEFCERQHYINPRPIRKPIPSERIEEAVSEPWHAEYINSFSEDNLIDLTLAADYLDAKSLLDLCCGTIAAKFKGKTIDEIREKYGITEEFTVEEEERLKQEYPWALEDEEDRLLLARRQNNNI